MTLSLDRFQADIIFHCLEVAYPGIRQEAYTETLNYLANTATQMIEGSANLDDVANFQHFCEVMSQETLRMSGSLGCSTICF